MPQSPRVSIAKGRSVLAALFNALAPSAKAPLPEETRGRRAISEPLEERTFFSSNPLPIMIDHGMAVRPSLTLPTIPSPTPTPAAPAKVKPSARRHRGPVYTGPITITSGGTYTGNWQSTDDNTPAVTIDTDQAVTILNSNIQSAGTLIFLDDSDGMANNVTVKGTTGIALHPTAAGDFVGRFIDAEEFANLNVQNCDMQGTAGIYTYDYVGNHTSANTVTLLNNTAENIDGRQSNGRGGWENVAADDNQYAQFFQANGLQNLVGAQIAWNKIVNMPNASRPEENINIFGTTGTKASHFLIDNNYIYGAYPANSIDEQSFTGGGIMLSDQGSCYIEADSNIIVNSGEEGMTISSGHDNSMSNNIVISDGKYPDGTVENYSNVGMVIWNANNERTFKHNSANGNTLGWEGSDGNGGLQRNDTFIPDASAFTNTTYLKGTVTPAIEASELTAFTTRASNAHQTIGV